MPEMMETLLNIGLNDLSVQGLANTSGNKRFAWDSYRRLAQMYGETELDIASEPFEECIDAAKLREGSAPTLNSALQQSKNWSVNLRKS